MKRLVWGGVVAVAVCAVALMSIPTAEQVISFQGVPLTVRVADSPSERARGLSGVAYLGDTEGMLFIFPDDGIYGFWMKDMGIAIDMLWLDTAGYVVHIEHAVAPESFPATFTSPTPARYVLEVRSGFALEHGIKVGSKFDLEPRNELSPGALQKWLPWAEVF